jgi:phospholipid-binding lipoprotein MlaA
VIRRKATALFILLVAGVFLFSVSAACGENTFSQEAVVSTAEIRMASPDKVKQAANETDDVKDKLKGVAEAGEKTADKESSNEENGEEDEEFEEETVEAVADPIEPFNRFMFEVNDKLYFYLLKPIAQAYVFILPEPARVSVRNFLYNLKTPVRLANCLLQGKFEGAAIEFSRFMVNTTAGVLGLFDMATNHFDLQKQDKDLGQTLGSYGVGEGFYIVWPVLGPSTIRDTVGYVGDFFADPLFYINPDMDLGFMKINTSNPSVVRGSTMVNETSLTIGRYEEFKESSIDPYISMRNAYIENRRSKIKK